MKVLVIDNYDSFVYNLMHMLHGLGVSQVVVVKNDQVNFNLIPLFDKILLSPGPGIPNEAGQLMNIIESFKASKSMLGVCLGHQAIGESFGYSLKNLSDPLHGISSEIRVDNTDQLFNNLPEQLTVGHYHSWVVENNSSAQLKVIATDKEGRIMALKHPTYNLYGVQFHPESVLTDQGNQIIQNWLSN